MDKGFKLIDGIKTDRSTRRCARSHAMKGKNVGKTHQRRSRCQVQEYRKPALLPSPWAQKNDESTERSAYGLVGQLAIYQSLPLPLILETAPRSLDIIKDYFTFVVEAVYPRQLCLALDHIKGYWVRTLFLDTYHCSLALMATLNGFVFASEAVPPEAIYHLGRAISLVNQRLGTAEGLSNSSIAVVNFLVIRDIFREDQLGAEIHLQGLRRMIELRGGLTQLEEDLTLALKVCKTDLDYALHHGTPTVFYRDRFSEAIHVLALDKHITSRSSACSGQDIYRINPFLGRIMLDVNLVAGWFNENGKGQKADPEVLQEVIVSVGYRLVRFRALGQAQLENKLEAVYHIGLVAFLTTLFLQVSGRRFLRYNLVAQCLKTVTERELGEGGGNTMLWLLFIGGISVLEETDRVWLIQRISQVAQSVRVEAWAQLQDILIQFPWISSIHEELGKALWEEVALSASACSS